MARSEARVDSGTDNGASRTGFSTARPARSFFETAREVILRPAGFYRDLDRDEPPKSPVIFAMICAVLSTPFGLLLVPFDPLAPDQPKFLEGLFSFAGSSLGAAVAVAVGALVLLPLLAVLGLYVSAFFQHLLVMIFVRPRGHFEATFKVQAYASALSLIGWIPVVSYLVILYGAYVRILGIRELHGTGTFRASLAVLVPMLFWLASLLLTPLLPRPGVPPGS